MPNRKFQKNKILSHTYDDCHKYDYDTNVYKKIWCGPMVGPST